MHVSDGDGDGFGEAGGSAGAVESESAGVVGPEVGLEEPGWVADWASPSGVRVALSPFEDSDADGEAEALGEAEGLDEAEDLPPPTSALSSVGCADALGSDVDPSTSDDSPPATAGLREGANPGASTPSSARLRPPAARAKPTAISNTRLRRRRWAEALRSRRLASGAAAVPLELLRPLRPCSRRRAARPWGSPLPAS
ncbi:hypothetical protein [Streptomyces sp. NPDC050287]|uniref:hypothetical protein n=1 Tax=Streptomyces sp. NPDC050287 TaxID=3365608 RepID=UPI00379A1C0D